MRKSCCISNFIQLLVSLQMIFSLKLVNKLRNMKSAKLKEFLSIANIASHRIKHGGNSSSLRNNNLNHRLK